MNAGDYAELVDLFKSLKGKITEENAAFYEEIRSLMQLLLKSGVATGISYENYKYILNELSPLPFVFANRSKSNTPKSYEYFRATQFKFYNYSNSPIVKMQIVKNGRVQQFDFVNGKELKKDGEQQDYPDTKIVNFESLSNIEYIMQQEKISFKDAILVLLGVYNCRNSIHNEKLLKIIEEYQETIKSDEYLEFLFGAIDRSKENKTYNKETLKFYIKRFDEYLLIKKGKANYNFKYQSVPKSLVLKRK